MRRLSNRQASVFAALIFLLTIAITYMLPGYSVTLNGLLVVIFLSVFIADRKSTLIALGISIAVVVAFLFLSPTGITAQSITEHSLMIVLIIFTAILVLHMKRLYKQAEFDKTHMTALFENATEGIILTNHTGKIILANPAAERMFRYSAQEIKGQHVEILIPQKYRPGHVALREGFYEKPQHRVMGWGRDLFAVNSKGENFPVEVSLSYYYRGEERYVIAFIVDITHRKEIEESMRLQQKQLEQVTDEIRSLNAELEMKVEERTLILKDALQKLEQSQQELSEALDKERQLNEIKSRFVSMASHEFRTPLSAVLSSASLIAKYTTTEQQPNRDKHINRIKDSVKHLNNLLEDFLSLGKLDEGKISTQPITFSIKEKINNTIDDMRGLLKPDQHIEYVHEGPETIVSDKNMMRNMLINLISNAIKFSDNDGLVQVSSRVNGELAIITVRDQGIGISEEDQKHLFSSFFRGKNATNIQGTGLGLHIVKRYLELLGGNIHLESALGKGTAITITLPVNFIQHDKNHSGN